MHIVTKRLPRAMSIVLAGISVLGLGQVASAKSLPVGDAAAGQQKSATCQGCHGSDGNSYAGQWPNLAGQHAGYISKQIQNFQNGERQDPTMSSMVTGLSQQDIADIAAYFSGQVVTKSQEQADQNLYKSGKKIYKGGNRYSGIPACSACHGPNGKGISPANFPVLAGQKVDYVIKALQDFKSSTRKNDPRSIMQNIASRLTENEIKSVAAYINALVQ